MESQTHIGNWWLPSAPEVALHGTLSFTPTEGGLLNLSGSFHEMRDFGRALEEQIILGTTLGGQSITLFECVRARQTINFGGTPTSEYRARFVLIGHHFLDSDSIAFHKYRVRYAFLEQWIAQPVFHYAHEDATSGKPETHGITYSVPEDVTATLPDFVVRLTSQASVSMGFSTQPAITHKNSFRIESANLVPLVGFLQSTNFLIQNFLALGIGRATQPLEITAHREDIRVQIADDHTVPTDITILFRVPDIAIEDITIHPLDMVFSFSDIAEHFEDVLTRWFAREALLRPVYNLYFATLNSSSLYLDHEFLNLIYAIESYHRRTQPGKYLDDIAIEQVKLALTQAIPATVPEDLRSSLKQKLKYINEFSLRRRLREVMGGIPETLTPFIRDRGVLIDDVVNTRNYMTHHDQTLEDKSLSGESLYWATRKLRALVELCFLTELGFPEAQIRNIVENRQPFANLRGR